MQQYYSSIAQGTHNWQHSFFKNNKDKQLFISSRS